MTKDEALKLALEAFDSMIGRKPERVEQAITAIKEALAQPEHDNIYGYASSLATAIWHKHYIKESPKFALLDTTEGVLTQIDNMTCGLVREKPAQPEQEPVAWRVWGDNNVPSFTFKKPSDKYVFDPLYTAPSQRKSQFKEFVKWANDAGYDTSHTYDTERSKWLLLSPMATDLWKAWQAAHGIKE